jgi:hypothetical protein
MCTFNLNTDSRKYIFFVGLNENQRLHENFSNFYSKKLRNCGHLNPQLKIVVYQQLVIHAK